jgi:hypothetical protein
MKPVQLQKYAELLAADETASARIKGVAEQLLGEPRVLFQTMTPVKPASCAAAGLAS